MEIIQIGLLLNSQLLQFLSEKYLEIALGIGWEVADAKVTDCEMADAHMTVQYYQNVLHANEFGDTEAHEICLQYPHEVLFPVEHVKAAEAHPNIQKEKPSTASLESLQCNEAAADHGYGVATVVK